MFAGSPGSFASSSNFPPKMCKRSLNVYVLVSPLVEWREPQLPT